MKFLIIFIVALVAVVNGQNQNNQNQMNPGNGGGQLMNPNLWRQCAQESRVEQDDLNRFKNRDFSNARENVHCFTNCLLERMGLIQNGEILEQKFSQVLSQTLPPDQITPKIASCRAQARGQNKCENAYKFYVCLISSTGNNDILRFGEIN